LSLQSKLYDTVFRFLIGAVYAYRPVLGHSLRHHFRDGRSVLAAALLFVLSGFGVCCFWNRWTFLSGLGLARFSLPEGAILSLYRQDFAAGLVDRAFRALDRSSTNLARNQLPYQPQYSVYFAGGLAFLLTPSWPPSTCGVGLRLFDFDGALPQRSVPFPPLYGLGGGTKTPLVLLAFCLLVLLVHQLQPHRCTAKPVWEKNRREPWLFSCCRFAPESFCWQGSAPKTRMWKLFKAGSFPDISGAADNLALPSDAGPDLFLVGGGKTAGRAPAIPTTPLSWRVGGAGAGVSGGKCAGCLHRLLLGKRAIRGSRPPKGGRATGLYDGQRLRRPCEQSALLYALLRPKGSEELSGQNRGSPHQRPSFSPWVLLKALPCWTLSLPMDHYAACFWRR